VSWSLLLCESSSTFSLESSLAETKYADRLARTGSSSSTLSANDPDITNGPSGRVSFEVIVNMSPRMLSGACTLNCSCAVSVTLSYTAVTTMFRSSPSSGMLTSPAPPNGVWTQLPGDALTNASSPKFAKNIG